MSTYIQVTTRCNQACEHCLFGCRPGIGSHMDKSTFIGSLQFNEQYGNEDSITLGGGEPTMNPHFEWMLQTVMSRNDGAHIWFATNGLNTKRLWKIIRLAEELNETYHRYAVSIDLSIDYWHKYQDSKLRDFFKYHNQRVTSPFKTRDVSVVHRIINEGRAKRLGIGSEQQCCGGYTVKPWGDVRICSCQNSPKIGTVSTGIKYVKPISNSNKLRTDDWDEWDYGSCFKGHFAAEKGHRFI